MFSLDRQIPLESFLIGARFLSKLPSFLRHPIGLQQARATLKCRFENRETNFLSIAKRAIYEQAQSPYRELLKLAGCEYGDLECGVIQNGVEETLRRLLRQGVYLTVDEFKGRKPVKRGNITLDVNPGFLRNPFSAFHLPAQSGGSRSKGTPVLIDLAFVRGCAINTCLFLDARRGSDWHKASWETPGAGARFRLLKFSSFGLPPVRWFSQVDPTAPGLHPIFRWSERAMRWGSYLAGVTLPRPLHVPLDNPLAIAHWMTTALRNGNTPHIFTFASSAVRLCQAAFEAGVDLHGAQLLLIGEPVTAARLSIVAGVVPKPYHDTAAWSAGPSATAV